MRLLITMAAPVCAVLIGMSPAHAAPQPATSDRARIAPGPSERNEPAASEVRQTPVGGQTAGGTGDKPDAAEQGRRP